MEFLLDAFLFFLPAGIANMSPVFATRIPWLRRWNTPMDFGAHFRGKRLLGANKTWRGLLFGTLMGGATSLVIHGALLSTGEAPLAIFLAGCALGFGALFGDAVESFLKRQQGIAAGRTWFPFDQIDYIIGGLIFVYPITLLPLSLMAVILVLYFGLHLLTSYIGFLLGLKPRPI
jgi:CDP-2,3-bis-(O-geranylgeranyl)-sn-glycerol synthase